MSQPNPPKVHLINDIPCKTADGVYQMIVEIPAGTNEKWQTDGKTGELYLDQHNGQPRIIDFLPYPMNYGCIPQTVSSKQNGKSGDGDPLDVITLDPFQPRGSIQPLRILGAIRLEERGEKDTKIVAVRTDSPFFKDVTDVKELYEKRPWTVEILRDFFLGYKAKTHDFPFQYKGLMSKDEAIALIEECHTDWKNESGSRQPETPNPES